MNTRFHAHLFFELSDKDAVETIRKNVMSHLPEAVMVGPLLLREAGPLPMPMFQLEYSEDLAHKVKEVMESFR